LRLALKSSSCRRDPNVVDGAAVWATYFGGLANRHELLGSPTFLFEDLLDLWQVEGEVHVAAVVGFVVFAQSFAFFEIDLD